MKASQKLARAFKALVEQGEQLDSTASAVLSIVKGAHAVNEKKFDELVAAAYAANGWNSQVGRPANGSERKDAAPNTVRTYVAIMRRALSMGMHIARYDTFTALRTAMEKKAQPRAVRQGKKGRKATRSTAAVPKLMAPDFIGVEIERPQEFNLSLFHDLPILYMRLPGNQRELFKRQLEKLVTQYKKHVPETVVRRANGEARKAA